MKQELIGKFLLHGVYKLLGLRPEVLYARVLDHHHCLRTFFVSDGLMASIQHAAESELLAEIRLTFDVIQPI